MADDSKSRSRHRWRDKIFSYEEKLTKDDEPKRRLDEDVMDFLKPSATNSPAITPPRAPRIDVTNAQRWPGASELRSTSEGTHTPSRPPLSSLKSSSTSGKDTRSLSVTFARSKPEIIGEGGDESDVPAIEIARRRPSGITVDDSGLSLQSHRAHSMRTQDNDFNMANSQPSLQRSKTSHGQISSRVKSMHSTGLASASPAYTTQDSHDLAFRAGPLRRAPTGFTDEIAQQTSHIDDNEHTRHRAGSPPGPHTVPEMPQSATFQQRLRYRMSSEEGRAFHDSFHDNSDSGDDNLRPSSSTSNSHLRRGPSSSQEQLLAYQERTKPFSATRRDGSPLPPPHSPNQGSPKRKAVPVRPPTNEYNIIIPPHPAASSTTPITPSLTTPSLPTPVSRTPDSLAISQPSLPRAPEPDFHAYTNNNASSVRRPSTRGDSGLFSAGNTALEDFLGRVTHMWAIFRLTCELDGVPSSFSPSQWLRASLWWFLKGRCHLEQLLRGRARRPDGRPDSRQNEPKLLQPHVDLAKAWWIVSDIIPALPDIARYGRDINAQMSGAKASGDRAVPEVLDAANTLITNLKTLLSSMSRNYLMPPHQSLLQGQDQTIWVKYQRYAPDVQAVLSSGGAKSLLADVPSRTVDPIRLIPLDDNSQNFCYGRVFVHTFVSIDGEANEEPVPCVLSILRGYNEWNMKITLCSQSELLNVTIQGDRRNGPTWEDVRWNAKRRMLQIRLPRGFDLEVQFSEQDFNTLWSIYDYTQKVEKNIQPKADETIVHEVALDEFQYTVSNGPSPFAMDKMQRCRARVFERWQTQQEGGKPRRYHRGYTLIIATSPKHKNLGYAAHEFGNSKLMKYEFRTSSDGSNACAMILRLKEKEKPATALLVFGDKKERNALYSVLNGMTRAPDEFYAAQLQFQQLEIAEANVADAQSYPPHAGLRRLRWRDLWVTNREPDDPTAENVKVVMSDGLRIIARHDAGSVTDRMNVGEFFILIFLEWPEGETDDLGNIKVLAN